MSEENQQQSELVNQTANREKIEILRATIAQLTGILAQLDRESLKSLPILQSVESLRQTTEELATEVEKAKREKALSVEAREQNDEWEEATEIIPPIPETITPDFTLEDQARESWIDRILPSFSSLQAWWNGILTKIRSLLPAAKQLSDWVLTGIITAIVVIILLTSVLLLPDKGINTEIVETPAPQTEIPPELTAPQQPIVVENVPPPQPELTPEQSLIAAIQTQVAEITNQYAEGLILSIEADFLASRLIVTVSNDWYQLNANRQDKLANEMLQRSRKLDFKKLEIIDPQVSQLARNPVVGNNMVILKRN